MSTRFEYVPNTAGIEFLNELDLARTHPIENAEDADVLVLWYDEAIVIPGVAEDLIAFAHRIIATVEATTVDGRAQRAAPGPIEVPE
jgi:hypothetical protein